MGILTQILRQLDPFMDHLNPGRVIEIGCRLILTQECKNEKIKLKIKNPQNNVEFPVLGEVR